MGELALFSILKIIAKINSLFTLRKYRTDARMMDRVKDYKISIGFGLHFGWAIEGPIGSEFKVDLSYLSPNVNLSSRLSAATKQYGVEVLFSQNVYQLLSEPIKNICREIDTVMVKGSKVPLNLFTIDLDTHLPEKVDKFQGLSMGKRRVNLNIEKKMVFEKLI